LIKGNSSTYSNNDKEIVVQMLEAEQRQTQFTALTARSSQPICGMIGGGAMSIYTDVACLYSCYVYPTRT